ncbi:ATP-binding SpoIIE family protein phosphatase [Kineococcus xinjiangensis]|uniref:ATP-binding SpoIIE family protein phosphatase n=1 Tax=Kineococcus xinjiangensis TaxID=512762 RepID=UPI001304E214|nr:SpoIIE family protein phosphatase [Kineococcus xinjiangensis]
MDPHRPASRTVLEVATLSLREGHDLRAILDEVTAAGVEATGAQYGAFFYHSEDEGGSRLDVFSLVGAERHEMPATTPVRSTPLFAPTFSGEGSVRVGDVAREPRFGHNAHGGLPAPHVPVRSYLATPVRGTDGRVFGAVLYGHRDPDRFGEAEQEAAEAVAAQAAVAIDNARLFAAEREARETAERERAAARAATLRMQQLQRITALLSRTASATDVIAVVPEAVSEVLGCHSSAVYMIDPSGRPGLVGRGTSNLPPDIAARLTHLPLDVDSHVTAAFHGREPRWLLTGQRARYSTYDGLDTGSIGTSVAVPVLDRDSRAVGVLIVNDEDEREPHPDDVDLLRSVAAQVAQALERARLYDAERAAREQLAASVTALTDLARALQQGLLPRELPDLDRTSVAVRYLPAVAGAEVGGDWYDAIRTSDHVVFVIGDVQGHSTTAAGLMGQLRTAVRAYVSEGHGPAAVLQRTNRMLLDLNHDLFATCCLVQLDQRTGVAVVASAGHPLPMAADERGVRELTVAPGLPLGIQADADYEVAVHKLPLPTRVVLYTDGVVETAGAPLSTGEEALRASLTQPAASCEQLADRIVAGIPHRLTDDAAVLLLDYAGPRVHGDEVAVTLPTDRRAVSAARSFLRAELGQWRLEHLIDDSELVLSELVTNALVHTDDPPVVTLRYVSDSDELVLSVRDRSARGPEERSPDLEAQGGRGLLIVDTLATAWGVTSHDDGKTVWAELLASRPGGLVTS